MTAVIFISAHAVENPEDPYEPTGITSRMIYSQLMAGRSNFENSESIQEELRFWGSQCKNHRRKPMEKTITESISILNKELPPVQYSPILRLKPIRQREIFTTTYLTKIMDRAYKVVSSDADKMELYEYLWGSIEREHPVIEEFTNLILSKSYTMYEKFDVLQTMDIPPNRLLRALNFYIKELFYITEDYSTLQYNMKKIIYNKSYQLKPNFDETTEEIRESFYGIHLLYDSKHRNTVYDYADKPITNDNNIGGCSCVSPEDKSYITFQHTMDLRNPTADAAINRFSYELLELHDGSITLKDIVEFFKSKGYDELYVIDTSCRNFDRDIWTFEKVSTLEMISIVKRLYKKEQLEVKVK